MTQTINCVENDLVNTPRESTAENNPYPINQDSSKSSHLAEHMNMASETLSKRHDNLKDETMITSDQTV